MPATPSAGRGDLGAWPLATAVTGTGQPTVALLHGGFRNSGDWYHQAAQLGEQHRVVTIDLPGHGDSPMPPYGCAVIGVADDVRQILDCLGSGPAVLVGHSFSCRVVCEFGRRWPERVVGIVLVDGSRTAGGPVSEDAIVAQLRTRGPVETLRSLYVNMFLPTSPRELRERVVAEAVAFPTEVMQSLMTASARWDDAEADDALAALGCPVLALQSTYTRLDGTREALTGPQSPWLDLLPARVADLRIEIVPGTGHFSMLERPVAVTEALIRFVESLRRG
jgi:pimeloyl-ACP methyl ester carboxylesterase